MIPLNRKEFPSSKADLSAALEETAHRFLSKTGQIVDVRSRVFPYIDEIAVNLDGAQFDSLPSALLKLNGETAKVFEAGALMVSARQIFIYRIPLDIRAEAHDLDLHKGQDENGNAILVIHRVRDGILSVSAAQLDLENAIEKIVRQQVHGLIIDEVRLSIRARGQRSIAIDVRIQAHKLFLRGRIDISGQIDIDQHFLVKASNMKCKGDSAISSVACARLEPIFRQIEAKSFSLNSLPLGNIQVRDVRVAVADTVDITADLGTIA